TFNIDDATKLELARGPEVFEVEKDDKGVWQIRKPADTPGNLKTADKVNVVALLGNLKSLTAEKWVARNPTQAELDSADLKAPPLTAKVTLKAKDGKTTTQEFIFGKEAKEKDVVTGVYAMEKGLNLLFLVDPFVVKTLKETELRDRTVF